MLLVADLPEVYVQYFYSLNGGVHFVIAVGVSNDEDEIHRISIVYDVVSIEYFQILIDGCQIRNGY